MRRQVLISLLAGSAALAASGVCAQQPTPPAPAAPPNLDAVPEKMPFNNPYGAPIGAQRANSLIQAAAAEATKRGWAMNIAVVDSGANLVAFERMDNAQLASIGIAEHKFDFKYLLSLDDVVASRGGIPLIEDGKIIGAIGCSGGTGSQDEVTCMAG